MLRVWLPLTKDLRQQGLSNVTAINNGATYLSSGGKLGGTYSATASGQTITIDFANLSTMLANGKTYTLTCWVKPTGTPSSGWVIKLGNNNCGLWWAKSEARWVWNENDNGKRCANPTISADYTNWHHLAIVVDKTVSSKITTQQYVDGVLAAGYPGSTWDCSSHSQPAGTVITISPYVSQLNDIRLYNHCLSPMEVKELAKGLVLHYPLNRQGWGQENLDNFSSVANNWAMESLSGSNYSDSSYGNVIKLVTNAANQRMYHNVISTLWQSGQVYTVSFLAKADQNGRTCDMSRSIADFSPTFTLTTQWKRYSGKITSTATPGGGTLSFRINQSGATVYITQIKLEKGTIATPYCPSSSEALYTTMGLNGTTEYDCSGFCNNGTRTGTFTWISDTPKYAVSTKLTTGSKITSSTGMITTANPTFTCNFWVKIPSATYTTWADIITFPGSATIRMETSNTAGTSLSWYNYPIGTSRGIGTNGAVNNTDWNMFTLTCDGTNWKTYKNGVLANTTAISGTAWTPNGTVSIGDNGMYAQLSDFRIYATALSADDVKSLYQNSAYIDSSGNVYGAVHSEV